MAGIPHLHAGTGKGRSLDEVGMLRVTVQSARGLKAGSQGTSDPYTELHLGALRGEHHFHKTSTHSGTCDPVWNDTFECQCRAQKEYIQPPLLAQRPVRPGHCSRGPLACSEPPSRRKASTLATGLPKRGRGPLSGACPKLVEFAIYVRAFGH